MSIESVLTALNEQVQDIHNWRNIQEIVRSTFKLMNDILQHQAEAIRRLEQEKISQFEYAEGMKTKADAADVSLKFDAIGNALNEKASTEDVAHHMSLKADKNAVQEITSELRTQMERKTEKNDIKMLSSRIDLLTAEVAAKANSVDVAREMESKANITEVNEALDTKCDRKIYDDLMAQKASRTSVSNALKHKANVVSVEEALSKRPTFEEIENMMKQKADVGTLQQITQSRPDTTKIKAMLDSAVDDVQGRMENELKLVGDDIRKISQKIESDGQVATAKAAQDVRELKALISTKVERNELSAMRDSLVQSQKAAALTLGEQMDSAVGELQRGLEETQKELRERVGVMATRKELAEEVKDKVDRNEIERMMNTKVDKDEFQQTMENKADIADVTEALTLKASAEDVKKLTEQTSTHRAHLKAIHKTLETKASTAAVEDVAQAIEKRPSMNDLKAIKEDVVSPVEFRTALDSLTKEIESRATVADLRQSIVQQNAINETLCGEQCVGRWVWRSGKVKSSGLIPWNVQVANSAPDVYLWEKDKSVLGIVQPGLYELTFGFYAKKKPSVQVLVNGEAILSAVNTASYVVHHSSGRMLSVGSHPAGNVTGLTMIDFIALPPSAKISISYSGEDGAEGFIGLKKLC